MLINHNTTEPLYVLGQSVQSEEIAGFIGQDHDNVQVIHHESINKILPGSQCVIGFTNIDYRIRVIGELKNVMSWPTYIHPTALIESTANIGIGCIVYPMSTVLHRAVIGDFSTIFTHVHISHGTKFGHNVVACPGTIVGGSTTVGDNVFFAQSTLVRDKIAICSGARFGIASVVTKSIEMSGTYINNKKVHIVL